MRALSLTLLFLSLLFVAGSGMSAHAASLSEGQVRSIILLLESFGAEPSVVTSVNASLRGETLSPVSTPAQSDPTAGFTHTLYLGSFGDDVSRLQMFLKKFPDIYPEGLITGYYGSLTQRATERFQKKYGIVSRGTPQTTGYGLVGPKTRTMLNYLLAKQATSAIPAIPTPVATIPEPSSAPATASMTVSTEASGESQPTTVVARAASETTQTTQTTNTNTTSTGGIAGGVSGGTQERTQTQITMTGSPAISSVSGTVSNGQTITISGTNFSTKSNAKPLLWWKADGGSIPSPLGRLTTFSGTPGGAVSTQIVAPGSTQSWVFDHGASTGAVLGAIYFASDQLYIHRKTYEDFDITSDYVIRSRVSNVVGTFSVGQTVTGQTSGATGVIHSIWKDASVQGLLFEKGEGTVGTNPGSPKFIYGETMTSETGSGTNIEGSEVYPTGTFYTFNFKTVRLWYPWSNVNTGSTQNNIHMGAQGIENPHFRISPEHTGQTFWSTGANQLPRTWKREEFYYQTSDVGVKNGIFDYVQNGKRTNSARHIMRDLTRPNKYTQLYQSQVSNGAQINSNNYYDSLYVDDTWHHIELCNKPTYTECTMTEVQIPTAWSDSSITVSVNLGGFDGLSTVYLYVTNANGVTNQTGYAVNI